ncbi:G protein-coupled glucose receptor regulating Gpa2-domain-containing protein [Pseudomassariella vexata]|uniref:G protein-coupled glucose receptor regulating Gpa2-domain-containing protein n=1 Tax=Pseudomassariella vexata TaxID=1141098 RepID=A0A1Y2DHB4_9PEZI|nr:G protein-coupled glucose receptor regulating Gpa2-domain-containing protein [Pseudomassariella vexata]ORY58125.1 G protein-coupled glucose receptor regulating Gpa2-domain-containing protein [Pseudomassariella vexata]
MAPHVAHLHGSITRKHLQDRERNDLPPGYNDNTVYTLEALSLSLATVSVFAALVAFYWFVRMRRGFRQDLIMLLIQSDMMKAFWLMCCPMVYFARGQVDSSDTFCQVSAFFLTASIEASDIAVLMIAIHSGLYIFRPQRSGGETGLYPYRRYAYAIWFILPLILAAIVPISGAHFADTGTHCYLPIRPLWYRTALSWIPRYIVFVVILITYAWVYLYLGFRFRRLRLDQRRASFQSGHSIHKSRPPRRHSSHVLPPTPTIVHHGLLDLSPRPVLIGHADRRDRTSSVASTVSTLKLDEGSVLAPGRPDRCHESSVPWNWLDLNYDGAVETTSRRDMVPDEPSSPMTVSFALAASTTPAESPKDSILTAPATAHSTPFQRPVGAESAETSTSNRGLSSLLTALRQGPSQSNLTNATTNTLPSVYLSQSATDDVLQKSRGKMRRQLRLLFVYPLMYIITWLAPFASHVLRYDDNAIEEPQPFALLVASVASLCIGAAVDCCFFCAWEKPWRNLRGGFWEGLTMRLRIGSYRGRRKHMGRSKEEEFREARYALDRRNQEIAELQAAMAQTRPSRQPMEWWDIVDVATEDDQSERTEESS